jgi:mRNA interferase MazF
MEKDFDQWNDDKKAIHKVGARPFYHARVIWWCALGVNIANEVNGTGAHHDRPLVIIRPFSAETFFGVALIGHPRTGRFYFPIGKAGDRDAVVNLSQARLYDIKRLLRKIGSLTIKPLRSFPRLSR